GRVRGTFDAVIACDNALPHLQADADLRRAAENALAKLRSGGVFLASTRDYDEITKERPRVTPPRVYDDPAGRRVVFQVWDWFADGKGYRLQLFFVRQAGTEWQTSTLTSEYRALLRSELTAILEQ